MPTLRLTARAIPTLRPHPDPSKRVVYRDTEVKGLYLEVFGSGTRTFGVWFRVKKTGKAGRLTLGRYEDGVYDLADARDDARKELQLARARDGENPAEKKRRDRAAGTFGDLARSFLAAVKDGPDAIAPLTHAEWTRMLGHDDLAPIVGRRTHEIERGDIIRLLDRVAKRAPIQANRELEFVRRVYSWGVSKDHVSATPCVGIQKPSRERTRTRSYSTDELAAVLRALDEADQSRMRDAIRLCLYTGVRIQQALGAPWSEFDLVKREWRIGGARAGTKNRLDWLVPLPPPAVALLEQLRTEADEGATFVFAVRRRKGDEGGEGAAWRQQRVIYDLRARSGVADFRPHDLRRSLTSWLASQRVPKEVRDAILGHRPPRLEGTYNVHSYGPEKRKALDRWAAHVERLARDEAASKVVSITEARA